jgi:hypothetical protein
MTWPSGRRPNCTATATSFSRAYYSAPFRLVGQELWVCAGIQQVRIFNEK